MFTTLNDMLRPIWFVSCLFLLSANAFCQQGNYWFFGFGAGLDFSSGSPVAISGSLEAREGCATVSDVDGNLLFYTNGINVWNRDHALMPNGYDLRGNTSSAQSSIAVAHPGDPNVFYIFTTDADESFFNYGLNYSTVDMRLSGGLGDVQQKNILLVQRSCEKLTAVKHANNRDVWVISHGFDNDAYYAHLVTPDGVSHTPVVTHIGGIHGPSAGRYDAIGLIRSSGSGDVVVATLSGTNAVEIMDFDRNTGTFMNLASKSFTDRMDRAYGIEFSSDESKLYVTSLDKLFQFDMNAGSYGDVLNSAMEIAARDGLHSIGQLQMAPDEKIYVAMDGWPNLGVIHDPNASGLACNFEQSGIDLQGGGSALGLPNSIAAGYDPCKRGLDLGPDTLLCNGQQLTLTVSCTRCDVKWSTGATSNSINVTRSGEYWVELFTENCLLKDTVIVEYAPEVSSNFGGTMKVCEDESVLLDVWQEGASYQWNDGTTSPQQVVTSSGQFWVDLTFEHCVERRAIDVSFEYFEPISLGADTLICSGNKLELSLPASWSQIAWSTGSSDRSITISSPGTYWADVYTAYCHDRDTVVITYREPMNVNLGPDLKLCLGEVAILDGSYPSAQYAWSTGARTPLIEVSEEGEYSVVVQTPHDGCHASDAVVVQFGECLDDLYIPNVITPNADASNDFFEIRGANYTHWHLLLYNRWGQLIYESLDYREDWNADGLPSGVYYYVLTTHYSGARFNGWLHVKK